MVLIFIKFRASPPLKGRLRRFQAIEEIRLLECRSVTLFI